MLSLWLVFIGAVSVCITYTKNPKPDSNITCPGDENEKAILSQSKTVPGRSPVTYLGLPSKVLFQIKRLNLIFGRPEHPCVSRYVGLFMLPKFQGFES